MSHNILHAMISSVECVGTSASGNPWYRVMFTTEDAPVEPRVLMTKKDASVNYGISNKEFHWPNRVTLVIERHRITHVMEES